MLKAFASLVFAGLVACVAHAQPAPADASIPPALRDWRPWVTKDLDYRSCPFLANSAPASPGDFVCAWPGRLTLSSNAGGTTFAVHWRVEAPSWVSLPGDEEHWPQQVTINGQRQPVLLQGGLPRLWLVAGSYEVTGRIPWREQPQSLALAPFPDLRPIIAHGRRHLYSAAAGWLPDLPRGGLARAATSGS